LLYSVSFVREICPFEIRALLFTWQNALILEQDDDKKRLIIKLRNDVTLIYNEFLRREQTRRDDCKQQIVRLHTEISNLATILGDPLGEVRHYFVVCMCFRYVC
jgi:hypothetical protein